MIPANLVPITKHLLPTGTLTLPYTFKVFEEEDIVAKVRLIADGSETELILTTDYILSGVGDEGGGNLTLIDHNPTSPWVVAGELSALYELYISFNVNIKQLTKFRDLGNNAPKRIESGLDRLTMFFSAFFSSLGIGEVARALKLPTNVHPDEFDPTLPEGFNSEEGNILAVNAAKTAFEVVQQTQAALISYTPGPIQSIAGLGFIAVTALTRQHVRVKSTGGAVTLNATPFGVTDALLVDGMEIIVEADDAGNTLQINENDNDYGFLGNGGVVIKYPYALTFLYNANKKRFLLKSNGAW